MDFVKSSTREETKEFFMDILKREILQADEVDISTILRHLESFENVIMDSLRRGEKDFLIPKAVKEIAAYSDPLSQQGVRGVIAWNYLYPEQEFQLPEKLDIIKVKLTTESEVEKLKDVDEKHYNTIVNKILNNPDKKLASKGVSILALPRNVEKIPDWVLPFIDYDTIVNDNISRFYSVLESLGLQPIRTTKAEYFTNILKV